MQKVHTPSQANKSFTAIIILFLVLSLPVLANRNNKKNSASANLSKYEKTLKLAKKGSAKAQVELGSMYSNGRGVRKSNKQAVFWWRKAAKQGSAGAEYRLGIFHERGIELKKSISKAIEFYRKAAKKGYVNAQYNLAAQYHHGNGVKKSPKKAFYWFKKAADAGDADAQCSVALAYLLGNGVTKSYSKGKFWLTKGDALKTQSCKGMLAELNAMKNSAQTARNSKHSKKNSRRSRIESCQKTEGMLKVVNAYGKTSYKWGKVVRGGRVLTCKQIY